MYAQMFQKKRLSTKEINASSGPEFRNMLRNSISRDQLAITILDISSNGMFLLFSW